MQRIQQQQQPTIAVADSSSSKANEKSGGGGGAGANKVATSTTSSSSFSTAKDNFVQASDMHSTDFDSNYNPQKSSSSTTSGAAAAATNNQNTNNNNNANTHSTSTLVSSAAATTNASSRLDKNDNTLNELKLARQDNEMLKKEVARLKVYINITYSHLSNNDHLSKINVFSQNWIQYCVLAAFIRIVIAKMCT